MEFIPLFNLKVLRIFFHCLFFITVRDWIVFLANVRKVFPFALFLSTSFFLPFLYLDYYSPAHAQILIIDIAYENSYFIIIISNNPNIYLIPINNLSTFSQNFLLYSLWHYMYTYHVINNFTRFAVHVDTEVSYLFTN